MNNIIESAKSSVSVMQDAQTELRMTRELYEACLRTLSVVCNDLNNAIEVLHWVAEHPQEFGDVEDYEKQVYEMSNRARIYLERPTIQKPAYTGQHPDNYEIAK